MLFALSDRDAQKLLWLADNGDDNFWLAQRPKENALNSPPWVETLKTLLGDGLPAESRSSSRGSLNATEHRSDRPHCVSSPVRAPVWPRFARRSPRTPRSRWSGRPSTLRAQVTACARSRSMSCSTARAAATACPTRTSTRSAASAAPIVMVTSGCTPEFSGGARSRRAGWPSAPADRIARLHPAARPRPQPQRPASSAAGASVARAGGEGRVIAVFSPEGGIGKSTLSTGLAGASRQQAQAHTLLIDLDLQFGDVGIMMGIDPTQTIVDLVTTTGELDPDSAATWCTTPRGWTSWRRRCARKTRTRDRIASASWSMWRRPPTTSSCSTRRRASTRRRSPRSTAATAWC